MIKDKKTLDEHIRDLARDPDILQFVKQTEARTPTTKDHYGVYMSLLSKFSGDPVAMRVMPKALKYAGANAAGVDWAVKLLTGNSY